MEIISYADNIKVVSMRGGLSAELGWTDVRVDRSSVLGNPFELTGESQRALVIRGYKEWLWENIKLQDSNKTIFTERKLSNEEKKMIVEHIQLKQWYEKGLVRSKAFKYPKCQRVTDELNKIVKLMRQGKKVRLVCWCGEGRCHADVIKSCLLWRLQK